MKKCPQGHENPDNAIYCRICGCELSMKTPKKNEDDIYTPDVFPQIDLIPKSMYNPKIKMWRSWIFFTVFFCLFLLLGINGYINRVLPDYIGYDGYDIIAVAVFFVSFLIGVMAIRRTLKMIVFCMNVSYIETGSLEIDNRQYRRVAKKAKLGLYDTTKQRIRLKSKYNDIRVFDNMHLLITEEGKSGLYSVKQKKMIVPIKYDKTGTFNNYIVDAHLGGMVDHYDIKGNLKR